VTADIKDSESGRSDSWRSDQVRSPDLIAAPRYATQRTPERANLGDAARKLARLLGITLMPWQEQAVELFTEQTDEGRFAFSDCTLLVARQSGKSSWALIMLLLRALGTPGSHCFYAAQTLKDARAMMLTTWVPLLDASPLAGSYTVRSANGSEAIRFKNGSSVALLTSTSTKSGHGLVCDFFCQDEAFALPDSRTEVAMRPAMATRTNFGGGPQFVTISTAGTPAGSPYLLHRVEQGRQFVEAGVTSGAAYIEFSAPDDADPSDPTVWAASNPALNYTISEEAIRAEFNSLDSMDFRRSRLCQWTTAKTEPVVGLDLWNDLIDRFSHRGPNVVIGFDSAPDGSASSVALASVRDDDLLHVEVLAFRPGTAWLASEVARQVEVHRPYAVVADSRGPHGNAFPELRRLGVDVRELAAADAARAYSVFVTSCQEKQLRHTDQPMLTAALTGAVRRPLGDAYAWSRRSSAVDISPLVAATNAAWAARSVESSPPEVWSIRELIEEIEEERRAAANDPT